MKESLLRKYRPEALRDVIGHRAIIQSLQAFGRAPYPAAFLFHGPTGVGKTATGWALAHDLGCCLEHEELGGIYEIPSGRQDGKAVDELLKALALRPLFGSGWKVALINEADRMTDQAEAIWLDGLERLPAKTVIVFTTNDLGMLSDRLICRCEPFGFEAESAGFRRSMLGLIRRIWTSETGGPAPKLPPDLGRFELASGHYSIRLALQQIAPYLRTGEPLPERLGVPMIRERVNGVSPNQSAAGRKAWETRRKRERERESHGR